MFSERSFCKIARTASCGSIASLSSTRNALARVKQNSFQLILETLPSLGTVSSLPRVITCNTSLMAEPHLLCCILACGRVTVKRTFFIFLANKTSPSTSVFSKITGITLPVLSQILNM